MYAFALSTPIALSTSFALSTAFWSLLPPSVWSRFQEAASSSENGLTFGELVASLPTDLGSIVALALLVGFAGFVIYFGQKASGPKRDSHQDPVKPEEKTSMR